MSFISHSFTQPHPLLYHSPRHSSLTHLLYLLTTSTQPHPHIFHILTTTFTPRHSHNHIHTTTFSQPHPNYTLTLREFDGFLKLCINHTLLIRESYIGDTPATTRVFDRQ